jgi:hypothetical protein
VSNNTRRQNARPTPPASPAVAGQTLSEALAAATTAVVDPPAPDDATTADIIEQMSEDETEDDADGTVIFGFSKLDGDTIPSNTGGDLLPFAAIKFARAKNPKTFTDTKTGGGSRTLIQGAVQLHGANGPTELYMRFSIGLRWEANAEDDADPSISMPTQGGKFNAALDSDDAATTDALEAWKNDALKAGIVWLQEQIKKTARPNAPAFAAPVKMRVSAASLGLSLKNAAPAVAKK